MSGLEKVAEVLCNEAIKQHGGIVERDYSAMSSSGKAKWLVLARAAITTLAANVDEGMVGAAALCMPELTGITEQDMRNFLTAAILKAGE